MSKNKKVQNVLGRKFKTVSLTAPIQKIMKRKHDRKLKFDISSFKKGQHKDVQICDQGVSLKHKILP